MAKYSTHIHQAHTHTHNILAGRRKILIIHHILTGGRKVIILLLSSRAKKLTPGILCLMEIQTVSLKMVHP